MSEDFGAWDMVESERDGILVFMDLPGMGKDSFDLQFDGHDLIVSGTRVAAIVPGKEFKTTSVARHTGEFRIVVPMPTDIVLDAEALDARYKVGVLKISIPKKEQIRRVISLRFTYVKAEATA
eukprot:c54975_g1_i1.p1 GENE.c54975_g1_i1~~c54975_g1_i1.p1  ORF type:complete len:139 (+),score=29.80 c54975_g1_i1:51-419(+)